MLANAIIRQTMELQNLNKNPELDELLRRQYKMQEVLIRRIEENLNDTDKETLLLPADAGPVVEVLFCCLCNEVATGRIVFQGKDDKIVDNPFCDDHTSAVYVQTQRALKKIHSARSLFQEYTIIQRWRSGVSIPKLPEDKAALIMGGARTHNV